VHHSKSSAGNVEVGHQLPRHFTEGAAAVPLRVDSKVAKRRGRWTNFDQRAAQQTGRYSITSSAVVSSACGIDKPSALAVLRLITSSNLVDCCTGNSAGFAPLRIRPV
jgi:hypothetical protein